uniref:Uncharacterized protein n=1 Tax=Salix viminalis TaxID=40686 RepID=A0A6N2M2S2_SALVM
MTSMLAAPNDENDLCLLQKIFLSFIKTIVQGPTGWSSISSEECCRQNAALTGSGAIWARVSPQGNGFRQSTLPGDISRETQSKDSSILSVTEVLDQANPARAHKLMYNQ